MSEEERAGSSATRITDVLAIASTGGFAGGGLLIGVSAGGRWLGLDPMVWQQGF